MYQAENISYTIEKTTLLKGVSLTIKPNCFTVILGANGAGKSTLMKVLSGEIKNYEGTVRIKGKNIKRMNELEIAKTRAVLSQHTQMHFPYTVLDVVALGGIALGKSNNEVESIALDKLKSIGMIHMQNRQFLSLSGGEQQKVHLARVLTQINQSAEEQYLFLDEPTSALDMAHQHLILGKVSNVCKTENVGVLAILHDLNLAVQYADEILFLKRGKSIAKGAVNTVFTKDIIQETYQYPVDLQYNKRTGLPLVIPFLSDSNAFCLQNKNEQIKSINYDTIYS